MSTLTHLQRMSAAIFEIYGVVAKHEKTVPVTKTCCGEIILEREVEVFVLLDHPEANRCFAWAYTERGVEQTTAILDLPPVNSPETAVQALSAGGRLTNRTAKLTCERI